MFKKKKLLSALTLSLLIFAFAASGVYANKDANNGEYKAIVRHLKTKYQAKKVRIPFMWLARFAVGVARPAGVKSFSVSLFRDLKFSPETLDAEMQSALRNSFSAEWFPVLRLRSRGGQQAYMYMREAGESVKVTVVTIDKQQAAVIRATFNPEKLTDFIENPQILGISLNDVNQTAENKTKEQETEENPAEDNQDETEPE
jgi:hypothetical protein